MRDEPREMPGPEDICLLNEQQAEDFFGPAWRLRSREQTVRFGDITAIASTFPRSWLEQAEAIQRKLLAEGRDPLFPNTLLFLCPAPGRQPVLSAPRDHMVGDVIDHMTNVRGFHSREHLFFERLGNGDVRVRQWSKMAPFTLLSSTVVDAHTWASIVASMSYRGEDANSYREALEFHERR